jgi:hypothetical protein
VGRLPQKGDLQNETKNESGTNSSFKRKLPSVASLYQESRQKELKTDKLLMITSKELIQQLAIGF